MTGLLLISLFGLVAAAWWRLLHGKEKARRAALTMCQEHGLLLMDDTVMLNRIRLSTESSAHGYGLEYRFDFVHEGVLRTGGSVLVGTRNRATVAIPTRDGQLIQEF